MEAHTLLAWSSLGTNRYGPALYPPGVQVWTATHGACDLLSRNPPVLKGRLKRRGLFMDGTTLRACFETRETARTEVQVL